MGQCTLPEHQRHQHWHWILHRRKPLRSNPITAAAAALSAPEQELPTAATDRWHRQAITFHINGANQVARVPAACLYCTVQCCLLPNKVEHIGGHRKERRLKKEKEENACVCPSLPPFKVQTVLHYKKKSSLSLFILKQDTSFGSKIERALAVFNVQGDSQTLILFSCCSDGQGRDSRLLHCVHWIETFKAFLSFCNTWTATVREKKKKVSLTASPSFASFLSLSLSLRGHWLVSGCCYCRLFRTVIIMRLITKVAVMTSSRVAARAH